MFRSTVSRREKPRVLTSNLFSIDISLFTSEEFDREATIAVSRENRTRGRVTVICSLNDDKVEFLHSLAGDEVVAETIAINVTAPSFGGIRRWFECSKCNRRCRILYFRTGFSCRICARAIYGSHRAKISLPGGALARSARKRLGTYADFDIVLASKPRNMHWKTYRILERAVWESDVEFDQLIQNAL